MARGGDCQGLHATSPDVARSYEALGLGSEQLRAFGERLQAEHLGTFTLDPARVYSVSTCGQVGVYVPIRGGAGHSYFGAWFDASTREVVGTVSNLFSLNREGNVVVKTAINDKVRVDAVLTQEGRIVRGAKYDDAGARHALAEGTLPAPAMEPLSVGDFLGCMNDCLSGLGLPSWVIGAIAVGCGFVCVGTELVGCIPCLYVAAGGYSAELGWCTGACF